MLDNQVLVGRFYKHYKAEESAERGDDYTYEILEVSDDYDRILSIGEYTERDDPRKRGLLVVYKQLYETKERPKGHIWLRPLEGPKGFTTSEGDKPRFTLL